MLLCGSTALVGLVVPTELVVPIKSPVVQKNLLMSVDYAKPIGVSKKKIIARETEQISFKMSGEEAALKRKFFTLLRARGLSMRDVFVDFMRHFVEFRGKLGVVPLSIVNANASFPQDAHNSLGTAAEISLGSEREQCHNRLDNILDYAPLRVRQVVIDSLAVFAEVALQQQNNEHQSGPASDSPDSGCIPDVDATPTRDGSVTSRDRRPGGGDRGLTASGRTRERSSA